MNDITVIGAGLAGCEAAYQLAERGFTAELYEMRPKLLTPAHKTAMLAEIVCSNSLGSENKNDRVSAAGILKEELALMNSLILSCANASRVPAGGALAVDREKFSSLVTERITSHKNIHLIREEYTDVPKTAAIISSGPLTSDRLAESLRAVAGERIYFYDAVAPVVTRESVDMSKVFVTGRYGRSDDYINCPMSKDEYSAFYDALIHAERNVPHDFEKSAKYFEGCMPVEALAERGVDTLRFGPMKPRGLTDPRTGREPYAAVQLRQDNSEGTLFNLVGFQTGLKWPEQKRVFAMIPGLENAEFVRLGVMHRNTSVNAPVVLDEWLRLRGYDDVFLAGQITGVEGYMESTAMGLVAGINASSLLSGKELPSWPRECAAGSLLNYLRTAEPEHFQPMNMNLGIFPQVSGIKGKKERAMFHRTRALNALNEFLRTL